MENSQLAGKRIAILVTDDFEQAELVEPMKVLEQAGATVQIIAPQGDKVQGMNHDVKADTFPVDMTLDQANPLDFDGALLPGGALNADALRVLPKAQAFVRAIESQSKPLAFICHAPWLLASADLLKGRTLTSYYTIQDDVRNAGGKWVDQEVVLDRNWVSSRSPNDLPAFNRAIINLFACSEVATH